MVYLVEGDVKWGKGVRVCVRIRVRVGARKQILTMFECMYT